MTHVGATGLAAAIAANAATANVVFMASDEKELNWFWKKRKTV